MQKKYALVGSITVLAILFLSISPFVVLAQYQTQQTTNFTIASNGLAHIDQSSTVGGISLDIAGTSGASGSVSTATYSANPQPTASLSADVTLSHFVVVTFNIAANKFQNANITVHYINSDISGMSTPYVLYKYIPSNNSYVKLSCVVDSSAKTITTTVTSTTDPLFAIGGATTSSTPTPTATPTTTPTPTPTTTPTPTPTASPTPTPTSNPTATPTPTPTPTVPPTAPPTARPTSTPTAAPTTSPTSIPTNSPTTTPTPIVSNVTISSTGTSHVDQTSSAGTISIDIAGAPGATGTVSTATYNSNPQPDASKPENVVLSHYVVVTFNMSSSDFKNATITISYTDSDVAGMRQPYTIYKYDPTTNKFIPLNGQINTSAKTITVTLTSTTDPLFAIGGTAKAAPAPTVSPTEAPETAISLSTWAWIFVAIEAFTGFSIVVGIYLQQRTVDNAKRTKTNQAK